MKKLKNYAKIAEKITAAKPREITTNYIYWIKRTMGKTGPYPNKFLEKILFYFFLLTTYPFYFTPSINKQGIVYIPKFLLRWKKISIRILAHEFNHYAFPELSEKQIRTMTKYQLSKSSIIN